MLQNIRDNSQGWIAKTIIGTIVALAIGILVTMPELKMPALTQFTSMLSLIEIELKKRKVRYAILTGQTRDPRRDTTM